MVKVVRINIAESLWRTGIRGRYRVRRRRTWRKRFFQAQAERSSVKPEI